MREIEETIKKGKFKDRWSSLEDYKIPKWYKDSKFGIFIHWGVYSVVGFSGDCWYPHFMYKKDTEQFKYHIENFGPHNKFGYKDFIPLFKAERFDPSEWADIFLKSGARFVIPVAEHHDGFCMYESDFKKWNSVNMGPKRDIIREIEKEVRKRGLYFGVSSHSAEHWWFFYPGKEIESDVKEGKWDDFYGPARPKEEIPDRKFLNDWFLRCCELVKKYKPDIFWFDWWINNGVFEPYLKKFAAYYYNCARKWKKEVVINYKYDAFPEGVAVYDIERGLVKEKKPLLWQIDTSISKNSWGYIKNPDYKETRKIICDIIDAVSKNGVYLLNIGPGPDGRIPEYEIKVLTEIGEWLKKYGEGIFETRPYKIYGEGKTSVPEGPFTDTKIENFTENDIRFTRKENIIYAFVLGPLRGNILTIKSLSIEKIETGAPPEIKKVELLSVKKELKWKREKDALKIMITEGMNDEYPCGFKIYT